MMFKGCGNDEVTPAPIDVEDGRVTILCLRDHGQETIAEVDAGWKVRESIDSWGAADSEAPEFMWLPPKLRDEHLQLHSGVAAYDALKKPLPYVWVAVEPEGQSLRIIREGVLETDKVLDWVKCPDKHRPKDRTYAVHTIDERFVDVEFDVVEPDLCGMIPLPPSTETLYSATAKPYSSYARPIPKSEWPQWCEAFPLERFVPYVYHTVQQQMGCCVGASAVNCGNEGPLAFMLGPRLFVEGSAMSVYGDPRPVGDNPRGIGRSPGSGASMSGGANYLSSYGMLPTPKYADQYDHTHVDMGDFYAKKPAGSRSTARKWKVEVYYVSTPEEWFAATMRDGLRVHLGRRGHALSGMAVKRDGRRYLYVLENTWGTHKGDFGVCIYYDTYFTPGYVYIPVLRDDVPFPVMRG
jgi:hypothetical protein